MLLPRTLDDERPSAIDPVAIAPWLIEMDRPWARLNRLGPIARMSGTPARWDFPPARLGSDPPRWAAEVRNIRRRGVRVAQLGQPRSSSRIGANLDRSSRRSRCQRDRPDRRGSRLLRRGDVWEWRAESWSRPAAGREKCEDAVRLRHLFSTCADYICDTESANWTRRNSRPC